MRMREIWLLVLLATIAFAWGDRVIESTGSIWLEPRQGPSPSLSVDWGYDARAPYYSFLPAEVQTFRSPVPDEAADEVCKALGGRLDFLQPADSSRPSLGFNCRFHEPDLTISAEFGDLRRMPARHE